MKAEVEKKWLGAVLVVHVSGVRDCGESGVCLSDICRSLEDICEARVEQCTCSVDK